MARLLRLALLSLMLLALVPSSALAAFNVSIVSGTGATNFDVSTVGGTKTYTANNNSATLGADTLESDLATGSVVVNTGSGSIPPFEDGTITVSSPVDTADTATGGLTLSAAWHLSVNAQMDLAGDLVLNSPLATSISQPINPGSLLTDAAGENFITADISAVGQVQFGGHTSSLDATVTSVASNVNFLDPDGILLGGDSVVNAGGQVSMASGLDGAYGLTVDADTGFVLGYTGGAIPPTLLSVTGNTQMAGDTVSVNGPITFNGDVSRVGSATFYASTFMLGGTLTAGDVTVNPSVVAAFANGSEAGTEAAPLTSIAVNGATSLGNTTVRTTGGQIWNGTVAVPGNATTIAADSVVFGDDVEGPGSLSVDTTSSALSFSDSIGATTPLTSLTIAGTQTTGFTGGTLAAGSASLAGLDLFLGPSSVALNVAALTIGDAGISTAGHAVTVTGGGSISGPISGFAASLAKAGTGTLVLAGANTYEGQTMVSAGDLRLNGSIPGDVDMSGGVLSGTGTIGGSVNATSAGLSPGASPGILTVSNDITLDGLSSFTVELNGATPGTGYDQVAVDGQLSLGGAALQVTAADSLPVAQALRIIDKTSGLDVDGIFAGRPEGAIFDVGAVRLRISYAGGDGNDVTLTRLKQPSSLTLSSGPANAAEGSPVTLTATVSGPSGAPSPTGTVTFKDGSTALGTVPVSGGVATLTTSALTPGDHSLSADFASDFYDPSSASASQHIEARPVPVTPPPPVSPAPAVSIKVADAKGKEKPKPGFVTFVVMLSRASAKPVTVSFATKNGTAKARKDFKAKKGTLTFKPGQTRLLVKVRIVDDKRKEKAEKFRLTLSRPIDATLARGTATGTIRDDD